MATTYPLRPSADPQSLAPILHRDVSHGWQPGAGWEHGQGTSVSWQEPHRARPRMMHAADTLATLTRDFAASSSTLNLGGPQTPLSPVTSAQPILPQAAPGLTPAEAAARRTMENKRTQFRPALTLGLTLPGNLIAMGGLETLAWGRAENDRSRVISGALLLAGGLGAALAPTAAQHADLRALRPKTAGAWTAANTLGTLTLLAGAYLRHLGRLHHDPIKTYVAMGLVAAGALFTLVANAMSFTDSEIVGGRLPLPARPQVATFSLSAGAVTAFAYGLSIRLNTFSKTADYAVFSAAYLAVMTGTVLQFSENRFYALRPNAAQDIVDSPRSWVPFSLVSLIIAAHVPLLIGVKLLLDGDLLNNPTYLFVGATVSCLSFSAITAPQIYFHKKIERCGVARAWAVTGSVTLGAVAMGAGAGLREWAASRHNGALAQASMAIAAMGALTVAGCAHESLHHGEWMSGRAPLPNRPVAALAIQAVGVSLGLAYGLGIRANNLNPLIDDIVLSASFMTTLIGSSLQYADSRWHEDCAIAAGDEVALRALS